MFKITRNKGFQTTFANGWTVSVQWGHGNYCENQSYLLPDDGSEVNPCPDAEIAAWDADKNWYRFECDSVKGRCSPDEVLAFMNMIAKK